MTAYPVGSGRSCERAVSKLFLEFAGGFVSGDIDSEYFLHGDGIENRRRLTLTIPFALVRALT